MKRSFFCSLLLIPSFFYAQSTFIRIYPGSLNGNSPAFTDLEASTDSGFLMIGNNFDPNSAYTGLLVKTNNNGIIQWSKSINGGNGGESTYSGFESGSGMNYAAGISGSNNVFGNLFITEINSNGATNWIRDVTDTGSTGFSSDVSIHPSSTGELLTVATGYDTWQTGIILAKHSVSGNLILSKIYKDTVGSVWVTAEDLTVKNTNNYLLLGFGSWVTQEIILIETDSSGNIVWQKVLGDPNVYFEVCSIENTSDGGSIIGGKYIDANFGIYEFLLIKLDMQGNIQWSYRYANPWLATAKGSCLKVVQGADGTYTGSVAVTLGTNGNSHAAFIKFDQAGTLLWAKCYTGNSVNGYEHSRPVFTADGKMAAVFTEYAMTGYSNALLIKTDLSGGGVCNDSNFTLVSTPVTYQITTPLEASDFGIPATYNYTSMETPYPMQTPCFTNVGISDLRPPLSAFVYPNPASNLATLSTGISLKDGTILLYNTLGEMVMKETGLKGKEYQLDLSEAGPGLYFISIFDEGKVVGTLKLLRE